MDYKYKRIVYWSKIDNCWLVEIPELPGCMSDGETAVEALSNVEGIIEEWIKAAKDMGRSIPIPGDQEIISMVS